MLENKLFLILHATKAEEEDPRIRLQKLKPNKDLHFLYKFQNYAGIAPDCSI